MASQGKLTLAGQERLYDITTFNVWVAARLAGKDKLAEFYQRRFQPECATAFAAWLKLDPINNLSAPPGPIFMPEYTNANSQESAKLAEEARYSFEKGVSTREAGDEYVNVTVLLATVLLLTALSQRFEIFGLRVAVAAVAFAHCHECILDLDLSASVGLPLLAEINEELSLSFLPVCKTERISYHAP